MMLPEWQAKLALLIISGQLENVDSKITDDSANDALALIKKGARQDPNFLLNETNIAILNGYKNMASIVVAMLFLNADESFLSKSRTKHRLINIMVRLDSADIEEIVDILRKNKGGRGLGSRPQKIIRASMEEWDFEHIKMCCAVQPSSMYNLLRLIHPRYKDRKAGLIKKIVKSK